MILMNDFKAEPQALREAMHAATYRVLDSGYFVLGHEVSQFEGKWAHQCGVSHGIGVGNGMDAIEITLRSLKIGAGDEVITTPMTAFATVLAIIRAGATPVLADIEEQSALLSLDSVRRCVSSKTKAIVLVHLYGQIRAMDEWMNFCRTQGLLLIEDCAQAHGATWRGKVAGSFGVAGAYSFYPTKNLGTPGDAGMMVTNDDNVAKIASQLRNYGQSERYHHPHIGMNSRLDEIQAAILTERLAWLPQFTERRQNIAAQYVKGINHPDVKLLTAPQEPSAHVYHLFVVTSPQRSALKDHLTANDIQTLIHYPIPVNKQESCQKLRCDPYGLPTSERHASQCLSLPCHPQLSDDEVTKVITTINSFRAH